MAEGEAAPGPGQVGAELFAAEVLELEDEVTLLLAEVAGADDPRDVELAEELELSAELGVGDLASPARVEPLEDDDPFAARISGADDRRTMPITGRLSRVWAGQRSYLRLYCRELRPWMTSFC